MRAIVALVLLLMTYTTVTVHGEPQVPCYFIFGDSLSDVGNNNGLVTKAKANYPPYGVDYPSGIPTGRFSNGRNFVDRITELLGFEEYIPAFSTARGPQILKGVNYASGASGIRLETGIHMGGRISMDQQLTNHLVTIANLAPMVQGSVKEYLNKCLYTVYMGNNDYLNNYYLPQYYISSLIYTPQQYTQALIDQYSQQLKSLYSYGARKVAVFGLGQIGCALAEIIIHGTNGSLCVDKINDAALLFNQKLVSLVDQLNQLPAAQFTYIGPPPSDTGSAIVNATCCKLRGDYQCQEFISPCQERQNYIFFDGFHPTEVVSVVTAERAYSAVNPNEVHPMDIKTLVTTTSSDQGLLIDVATNHGFKFSS